MAHESKKERSMRNANLYEWPPPYCIHPYLHIHLSALKPGGYLPNGENCVGLVMQMEEKALDNVQWGSWPTLLKKSCLELCAVNCQLKQPECDSTMLFNAPTICGSVNEKFDIPQSSEMQLSSPSAKCIVVTRCLWEYLKVVGHECQGGQISEFTRPMQWPSAPYGRIWVHQRQAGERRRQAWEWQQHAWEHQRKAKQWREQAWGHFEAHQSSLGKTSCSVGILPVRREVIANTYHSIIGNTHVFSLYCHLYIYVSIYIWYIWTGCRWWLR